MKHVDYLYKYRIENEGSIITEQQTIKTENFQIQIEILIVLEGT